MVARCWHCTGIMKFWQDADKLPMYRLASFTPTMLFAIQHVWLDVGPACWLASIILNPADILSVVDMACQLERRESVTDE